MYSHWLFLHHFTELYSCAGNGSGSSGTEDAASRRRRIVHSKVSGAGANPDKVMTDDSNGDNWDETSDSLADKTLDSYVPLVNGELVSSACTVCMMLSVQRMFVVFRCVYTCVVLCHS